MVNLKDYARYANLVILTIALCLGFLLIRPFIVALLTAAIVSYVFYPLHKKIEGKLKRRNLSAIITTVMVVLLITIPLLFALNAITRESYLFYITFKQKMTEVNVFETECSDGSVMCSLMNYLKDKITEPRVRFHLEEIIKSFTSYIIDNASKIPSKVVHTTLNLVIIVFAMFFMLRDGEKIVKDIGDFLPIKKSQKKRIIERFSNVTYGVIYGSIITAVIQGIVGAIGFFVFGVQSPLLWGSIMILAALVPMVGAPIIWLPASIVLILKGYFYSDGVVIAKGVGLFAYGMLIISSIDNFLKPKIAGSRGKVHPLVIFLGAIGGLKMFGLIGFVIGPLILAFCITFLKSYRENAL